MRLQFVPALCAGLATCVLLSSATASAAPAECVDASPTLEDLVACLRDYMPTSGWGKFVPPTKTETVAYRAVVKKMMEGFCDFDPPPELASLVEVRSFFDTEVDRDYCVLFESADVNGDWLFDRGFGAFIVDPMAEREICHEAPHPIADSGTEIEAATMFKWTSSRSYLVAGAHRDTSQKASSCQGDPPSDVAHDTGNMFYATNDVLRELYGSSAWWAIQWHGMSAGTCSKSDVHLSHGLGDVPPRASLITKLRSAMIHRHPGWRLTLPGTNKCLLNATDNVEGRLLNDVPLGDVCAAEPPFFSGRFLHIEQDPGFRDAGDWIDAIEETFPTRDQTGPRTWLRKTPSPSISTSTMFPF